MQCSAHPWTLVELPTLEVRSDLTRYAWSLMAKEYPHVICKACDDCDESSLEVTTNKLSQHGEHIGTPGNPVGCENRDPHLFFLLLAPAE